MATDPSETDCNAVKASFSSLPRELRDMLYHELWTKTSMLWFVQKPRGKPRSRVEINYGNSDQLFQPGLPCWLISSRQFLHEGFCQLLKHALWTYAINNEQYNFSIGSTDLNYAHLIDLTAITDMTLTIRVLNGSSGQDRHNNIQLKPDMSYIRSIWYMCDIVGPKLEHLTLHALNDWNDAKVLFALSETPFNGVCTVDLSCLKIIKLPLRSLRMRAGLVCLICTVNPHTIKEKLEPAWEQGLKRLGGAMVGRNGQVEVESLDLRSLKGSNTRHDWDIVMHLKPSPAAIGGSTAPSLGSRSWLGTVAARDGKLR